MMKTCAGCGGEVAPASSFCPHCGQKLDAAWPADRRPVTVLFADMTGFTSLAEGLDPEMLRSFQNALFDALEQAIVRYDGFVEKFVGDAVMAIFGAPRAHEDDPVRALEAAQDMMLRVDQLSRQWAARLGRPVTLHVGVHTGPVVAGSLGTGARGAYAVTGDTVNTASRLLAAAEPGTVLVSEATRSLARHRFDFASASELALRGKAQPLRVHRLVGLRADVASARGLAELGLSAPMVGRADAIESLLAAFGRMHAGRAQVVSVIGEAGVGKSRLLAELFARLERDGRFAAVGVRQVNCSSLGEPTYGTFGALFREAYRVEAGDSLDVARHKLQQGFLALGADAVEADTVARVISYLLGIEEARPHEIEPEQLQRQITLAARALIERRLTQQPLLIVVDDLHWADAASVDLLREVVDQLAGRPLMLLALQRPDGRGLRPMHAEHTLVELGPLDDEEARVLVSRLLGVPLDDDLAVRDLVAARADGNPLFVEEIVRSLVGRGLLLQRDGRWVCAGPCDALDVPTTLHGLLLSRIDRLGAEDRQTMQEAAVLGAGFDSALLRCIADEPRSADEALRRLAAADLIRPDGPEGARWRFTHALLHDVAYQNLLLARRGELHRRAGLALEAALASTTAGPVDGEGRSPRRLAELEALGHHWSLSPDKVRGARYLVAAGDWARAVHANDDAIRHFERALRTLDEAGADSPVAAQEVEAAQFDARERLADLFALQGRRGDALAHYEAVKRTVESRRDPVRTARLLRKIGGLHWEAGEREQAGACFSGGLESLGEHGDPIERAHLFQEMGRLAFRTGDHATALSLAQRALDELPAADAGGARGEAAVVSAQACNTLGVSLARLGRMAEAVTQIENSIAQAEASNQLQAACRGYTNLGVLYAMLDPQRSIETCLRGLETARKVGDLGFQSRLFANLAVAYCALTNRCEAEGIEAAQSAADLDRRLGLLDHLAVPLIVLGQIYQCHGDRTRAFETYSEALRLAERIDEPQLLFPCYDGLATLYLDTGHPAQAETYLAKAQAVCERAGLEPDALMVLPFLC